MQIAKILGTVVATRKHDDLVGGKIQVVQPMTADGETPKGDPYVALDAVGAGAGEIVLVVKGSSARTAFDEEKPVDATIIGIVDQIDVV